MAGSLCLPFTPNLHFTKPKTSLGLAVNRKSFMDSVDRVLAVSAVRRFTLNGRLRVDSDHTNRWRRNVLNNGVLDFVLHNTVSESQVLDVFACKTLENLKLNGSTFPMLPDDTSLPSLNEDPSNLFKGLRNVEKLGLSFPETFEVFDYYHEVVPMFENVTQLSILTDLGFCYSLSTLPALPSVLKKFPNVHTLVIEGDLIGHDFSEGPCGCYSEEYCTLSSPAKVLEIRKYEGSIDEMEQIKRFLEELSCLELVKVCAPAKGYKAKLRLAMDLLMLPRASSKCKIQIEFY